jgi:endoglucanase
MKKAFSFAFLLFVIIIICSCNSDNPANDSAWLTISNGRVVRGATGEAVILKGVNVDMFYYYQSWYPEAIWNCFDQWAADQLAADGVTLVRLAFHWNTLADVEPSVRLKPEALNKYKEIVGWLAAKHIYVVLDMHTPPGTDDTNPGRGVFWNDPANLEHLTAIWRLLADEFKNEPYILGYDIFNEPSPPAADDWWNLLAQTVSSIRQVDTKHLIVVEPPFVGGDGGFRQISDPLALYSIHFYEPFAVSHRGADWVGDTAIPTDGVYPGNVLTDLVWLSGADANTTITGTSGWKEVNALEVVAPEGAAYATVIFFGWGDTDALFDDASVTKNGAAVQLTNPDISEQSPYDAYRPKSWYHYTGGGFDFEWIKNDGHSSNGALRIKGNGEWAIWQQLEWALLTRPLIKVSPGDHLSARAYAKSLGMTGTAGVTFDFYRPVYKNYDRTVLEQDVRSSGVDWLLQRNLPVYIGEFGSMAMDTDETAMRYLTDLSGVLNSLSLHWTLWQFRESGGPEEFGFGVMRCAPEQTPSSCQTFRPSVYLPWKAALRE